MNNAQKELKKGDTFIRVIFIVFMFTIMCIVIFLVENC